MTGNINFRQLLAQDWEVLKAVGSVSLPITYPNAYWMMLTSDNTTHHTLGAFLGDELVGAVAVVKDCKNSYMIDHITGRERLLVESYGKVSYISSLVVAKKVRRRGIARELMKAVIEKLETDGSEIFYLHVMVENKEAMALYKKLGFAREERLVGCYNTRDLKLDAFLYVRRNHPSTSSSKCWSTSCILL